MFKKLLIGLIICFLFGSILGCNQNIAKNDSGSKPNNKPSVPRESITTGEQAKTITARSPKEIAMNTASAALKSIQKQYWPEARLDTILCETSMIHANNTFFAWNTGYSSGEEVRAFAIGNQNDDSKMLIVYVDASGKVIKNEYFESGITVSKANKLALEAAKKAKDFVPYWKNANIVFRQTGLMLCTPNYVFSMGDYNKKVQLDTVMYEVQFQDTNETISFLYIYVNAKNGVIVGAKYAGD